MSRWTHLVCDECYDRISGGEQAHRLVDAKRGKCCACGNETSSGIYIRVDPQKTLCKGVHPDDETEKLER